MGKLMNLNVEMPEKERARLYDMTAYEREYESLGIICGVDEAGRGPLAGPVVAGAVILPKDFDLPFLNDSKKLSAKKREVLFEQIKQQAVSYGVGIVDEKIIDEINILQATYEAMRRAIAMLDVKPGVLLNDAVIIPQIDSKIEQVKIIKGDAKSVSIAAASIMAKTTRDSIMLDYAEKYPQYGFDKHMGYPTKAHYEAIAKYGACPIHRKSYKLYKTSSLLI